MAVEKAMLDKLYLDRREDLTGCNFRCRFLLSPYNKRITVETFTLSGKEGACEMVETLTEKALQLRLEKIWFKSETKWRDAFLRAGLKLEASIPGFYQGRETALVLACYINEQRQTPSHSKSSLDALPSGDQKKSSDVRALPPGIVLEWGRKEHCRALACLYTRVFSTYPFPVFDEDYLLNTMEHDICYLLAWQGAELVAAASAEINRTGKNAEVTDFATLPEWRGRGLAGHLLAGLEKKLRQEGIRCLYTIARCSSPGMNKVFAAGGYGFRGVLIKNCNIAGDFEDMNVWSKVLEQVTH